MKKQLQILLAGALVVIPFAITVWVIWQIAVWLDGLGHTVLDALGWDPGDGPIRVIGALIVIAAVYLVGLLMHLWIFRRLVVLIEKLFARVPGVKTIYESVRDLLKLFGSDSQRMGRVVLYRPSGEQTAYLGILTSENPAGAGKDGKNRVAVYLPMAYMIGGPIVLVSPDCLEEIDMPVETALKLCATAYVGTAPRG